MTIVVYFSFLLFTLTLAVCPSDYVFIAQLDTCVQRVDVPELYHEFSELKCQEDYGHLLKINNQFENKMIGELLLKDLNASLIEIGLRKIAPVGYPNDFVWMWADGTNATYFNWAPNHPLMKRDIDCVGWNSTDLQWYSIACEYTYLPYICQTKNDELSLTKCDPEWLYFNHTNMCYFHGPTDRFVTQMTDTQAEAFCVANKSHLVSVHSEEESAMLSSLAFMTSCDSNIYGITLTGGTIYGPSFRISWTDGSPFDYVKDACMQDRGTRISIQAYPLACQQAERRWSCDGDGSWVARSTPKDPLYFYFGFFCKKPAN